MDEKGLEKIKQIIPILLKFKNENKIGCQGFNDRLTVAKQIYQRSKNDKEFVQSLKYSIDKETEEFLELIKKEEE